MNSPPDHQTVSRACSAPLNSLGDDTPGEKHKLQPQIQESVLSPAMCLVLLGWYRRPRPQDCSRHCTGYAVFLQLISCYTTRVSQIRITGISLQNRSSLFTKRWCRQVYFGLPNWGALCQFKLQVKSKYSRTSKPPYYTRSMYIKNVLSNFLIFILKGCRLDLHLEQAFPQWSISWFTTECLKRESGIACLMKTFKWIGCMVLVKISMQVCF